MKTGLPDACWTRNQGGLLGQRQTDLDHLADIVRREPQFPLRFLVLLEQFADLLRQVPLELEHLAHGFGLGIGPADARHRVAPTEHGLLDIIGQHRAVAAQVFPDRLDLLRHPHQELQVGVQVRGPAGERRLLPLLVALADEVVDEDLPLTVGGEEALLPVAVDAPVALLQPVRVPRDFVVDEPVAVVLEVQAFGGGVGGEQDAHRADFGRRLEGGFDLFPLVRVHAAVHGQQPVVAR